MEILLKEKLSIKKPPADLLNEIISANTFANPVFEANQHAGRSNWKTDSTIETYAYKDGLLEIPRGYCRDLFELGRRLQIQIDLEDCRRCVPAEFDALSGVELRPYQKQAIDQVISYDQGCIIAPTGAGKTIIGLELIRLKGQKALILVHRKELADQWAQVIEKLLGIKASRIGDGNWDDSAPITIGMIQTISKSLERVNGLSVGLVICDEVHHAPCNTFYEVLNRLPAKCRFGLSATPKRRDGLEMLIYRAIGHVLAEIPRGQVEACKSTVPAIVKVINTGFDPDGVDSWNDYLEAITHSERRNRGIISLIDPCKPTLVITDRVEHAEKLWGLCIKEFGEDRCVLAHGKLPSSQRVDLMQRIKSAPITIGTTGLLGEGIDVSHWEVLIMASPISSEIKLMQAVGRCVRTAEGKDTATIYDLKDDCGFAGASLKKRLEIYRKNKIWVESP